MTTILLLIFIAATAYFGCMYYRETKIGEQLRNERRKLSDKLLIVDTELSQLKKRIPHHRRYHNRPDNKK